MQSVKPTDASGGRIVAGHGRYRQLLRGWRLSVRRCAHYPPVRCITAPCLLSNSGHTQMCLVYNPEEIAVAAIYAALVCLRKELPAAATDGGKKSFCELFNVTAERLQGEQLFIVALAEFC